uniref:Uncharacterized protein n=1 Tax=Manihot esculenta TaxID=3983 RepID=A0A2C9VU89_MANES
MAFICIAKFINISAIIVNNIRNYGLVSCISNLLAVLPLKVEVEIHFVPSRGDCS